MSKKIGISISGGSTAFQNVVQGDGNVIGVANDGLQRDHASADAHFLTRLDAALTSLQGEHAAAARRLMDAATAAIAEAQTNKGSETKTQISVQGLKDAAEAVRAIAPNAFQVARELLGFLAP